MLKIRKMFCLNFKGSVPMVQCFHISLLVRIKLLIFKSIFTNQVITYLVLMRFKY